MAGAGMRRFLPALQLSLRAALAAGASLLVARVLDLPYPLYAMIAAVLVTDLAAAKTRSLAVPRLLGTVLGATLGAILMQLLPGGIAAIALGIFAAMLASHLLGIPEAAKLAGYVCALVLLEHGDTPWAYAISRFLETLLGVGMAVAVSLVPKLVAAEPPPAA